MIEEKCLPFVLPAIERVPVCRSVVVSVLNSGPSPKTVDERIRAVRDGLFYKMERV